MFEMAYRVGLYSLGVSIALMLLGTTLLEFGIAVSPIVDYLAGIAFTVFLVGGLILLVEALRLMWSGNAARSRWATWTALLLLLASSLFGSYVVHALYRAHGAGRAGHVGHWLFGPGR